MNKAMDLGTIIELAALIFGIIGIVTPMWFQQIVDRRNYLQKRKNLFFIIQEEIIANLHYISDVDDYLNTKPKEYKIFLEQSLRIEIIEKLISLDITEYLKKDTDLLFDVYSQALTINRLIDTGHQALLQDPMDLTKEFSSYNAILHEMHNFLDEFIEDSFKLWNTMFSTIPYLKDYCSTNLHSIIEDYEQKGYTIVWIDRTSKLPKKLPKKPVILCWKNDSKKLKHPIVDVRKLTKISKHSQYVRRVPTNVKDPREIPQTLSNAK